jgi:hypothetical protein
MLPSRREFHSDLDDTNVMAIIVFLSTRFPELTVPEGLVDVHLRTKMRKSVYDGLHVIHGDDNIVSIDTHSTNKLRNEPLIERCVERPLNPDEDHGQENHSLHGKAER